MKEAGCEFIVLCCFGDTSVPEDIRETLDQSLENTEWIHPAAAIMREISGVGLVITSCDENAVPDEKALPDSTGKPVPVIYGLEELDGCIFEFTETTDGILRSFITNDSVK